MRSTLSRCRLPSQASRRCSGRPSVAHRFGPGRSEARLGRDHEVVRVRRERLADQPLGDMRAVGVGGVDEGHAELDRPPQHPAALVRVGGLAPDPGAGDAHGAEPEPADRQVAPDGEGVAHATATGVFAPTCASASSRRVLKRSCSATTEPWSPGASKTARAQQLGQLALLVDRHGGVGARDHDGRGHLQRRQPGPRVVAPELAAGLGDVLGAAARELGRGPGRTRRVGEADQPQRAPPGRVRGHAEHAAERGHAAPDRFIFGCDQSGAVAHRTRPLIWSGCERASRLAIGPPIE